MSHVSVTYLCQCHMSNLINNPVTCHYLFETHIAFQLAQCRVSNLKKGCVALSILRVKCHSSTRPTTCLGICWHICWFPTGLANLDRNSPDTSINLFLVSSYSILKSSARETFSVWFLRNGHLHEIWPLTPKIDRATWPFLKFDI